MLIHQESAPAIIVNDATRTLSVPSPSTLSKIQSSMNEYRIECIDQLQNPPSNVHTKSKTTSDPPDFQKLRQQFISDSMEWSKKLSLQQQQQQQQQKQQRNKSEASFNLPASVSTVGMSMEDQEKLLSQHFEKMMQQKLTSQHSPSFTLSSTPSKLPFATLSVSSPQASVSPSRPRSRSPKPSPIQLPSSTATLNPMLNAGGLYGFMPTTSAFQGLQSPANLLFNPSSPAQYAAILNQYLQMMSPQSVVAGNKQPVVISDPAIIQSLQQAIVVLPDGSFAPANLNLDAMLKKDSTQQTSPTKTPSSAGKRAQSPNSEASRLVPPPKRRRSSSLPDITQLPSVVDNNTPIQEDQEAEEQETEEQHIHGRKEDTRKRNMPPLSMIQIPKEVKMHDPMLGFPTPPQSSPHFASSPLIPTVVSTMFQPHPMTPITPGQDSFNHEDIKDLVGETTVQTPLPASPNGTAGLPPCEPPPLFVYGWYYKCMFDSPTLCYILHVLCSAYIVPTGRGPIQLWQFLLDLLVSPDKNHLIHWTGNGYEFRILLPEEIAKLWGARKNKPRMNYDKLSRGLRYYYSKGIMDKVPGKKLTFKYTCDVPNYLQSRGAAAVRAINTNCKTSVTTET